MTDTRIMDAVASLRRMKLTAVELRALHRHHVERQHDGAAHAIIAIAAAELLREVK